MCRWVKRMRDGLRKGPTRIGTKGDLMKRGSKSDELPGRKGCYLEGQTNIFPKKTRSESKKLKRDKMV